MTDQTPPSQQGALQTSTSTFVPIVRRPDWGQRLSEFLRECVQEKVVLDWDMFSCASWACDGVEAFTGVDLFAEYRGKAKSMAQTYALIHKSGFDSLEAIVASKLPTIPVAFARRGDLLLGPARSVSGPQGESLASEDLALCIADRTVYWGLSEEGVGTMPIEFAVKAFAVGEHPCLQQ